MNNDFINLTEDMDIDEALELIKLLPQKTKKRNRHKFVFTANKTLRIARADIGNPSHSKIKETNRDKIAGYIKFTFEDNKLTDVYMNNVSKDFEFPKFELLKLPQICITKIFGPVSVDMEDVPPPKQHIITLPTSAVH